MYHPKKFVWVSKFTRTFSIINDHFSDKKANHQVPITVFLKDLIIVHIHVNPKATLPIQNKKYQNLQK